MKARKLFLNYLLSATDVRLLLREPTGYSVTTLAAVGASLMNYDFYYRSYAS